MALRLGFSIYHDAHPYFGFLLEGPGLHYSISQFLGLLLLIPDFLPSPFQGETPLRVSALWGGCLQKHGEKPILFLPLPTEKPRQRVKVSPALRLPPWGTP